MESPQPATYAVLSNGFRIRYARHEAVGASTRLFLANDTSTGYVDVPTSGIVGYEQDEVPAPAGPPTASEAATPSSPQPAADVEQLAAEAARQHQVDADFIGAVIRAESGGNARAVSPKGAQGLMQLMPETAARLGVADSLNPAANVEGGTRYLRALLEMYGGDAVRALAAYNAGPERVQQYGGVPPYRETRAYVGRVIRDYNRKKAAQSGTSTLQAGDRASRGTSKQRDAGGAALR